MCQSEEPGARLGLNSPDLLVREAFLMAHDYIDYVTSGGADGSMGPAPTACTAALRHAGDELLTRFPIFFRRWPRVFQDVTEDTACPTLLSILDEHFFAPVPGGRRRDLAWSAVLSVYVLAGQMALHCHERDMVVVLPQLKDRVGAYVESVICPEIRDKGGWSGFVSRFGEKQGLEGQVKKVCSWTLLALAISILTYCLWKRMV
ncbi:BCL2 like 16 isoform X1 [Anarrhichthys ocellatus]|uniref:BCL2 like 16 isoform X1 n=1 Tax=Anarrhichthys ocellatus TaxID=433405 RepID=UPI0012EDC870|nr:apoptosis regulator R1-like isoform X1 [Anarrhichthys ocellatus]